MFLNPDDLILSIPNGEFQQLRLENDVQLTHCLKRAEQEARGLIRSQFDETILFEGEIANRNALLLGVVVDIAAYHFLKLISLQEIPEKYIKANNDAQIWLNRIHKGSIVPVGFPAKIIDNQGNTNKTFQLTSADKVINGY